MAFNDISLKMKLLFYVWFYCLFYTIHDNLILLTHVLNLEFAHKGHGNTGMACSTAMVFSANCLHLYLEQNAMLMFSFTLRGIRKCESLIYVIFYCYKKLFNIYFCI